MSPEDKLERGPRKPIHLKGDAGKLYQEIKKKYGGKRDDGIGNLSYDELRSLAYNPKALDFLRGMEYYLDHKDEIVSQYHGQLIAVTAEGVIAASRHTFVSGVRAFHTRVLSPGQYLKP